MNQNCKLENLIDYSQVEKYQDKVEEFNQCKDELSNEKKEKNIWKNKHDKLNDGYKKLDKEYKSKLSEIKDLKKRLEIAEYFVFGSLSLNLILCVCDLLGYI